MEIRNFSSRVEKVFHEWAQRTSEIFLTLEEKFPISARPCNILYVCCWHIIPETNTLVHIIDQGKSPKEEFLNKPTCMKQILQKATHFVGVSLAPEVKVLGLFWIFWICFLIFLFLLSWILTEGATDSKISNLKT